MTTINYNIGNLMKFFISSLFLFILVLPLSAFEPEDFIGLWGHSDDYPSFQMGGGFFEVEITKTGSMYIVEFSDTEYTANNELIGIKRGHSYITWDYNEKGELISGTAAVRGYGFHGTNRPGRNAYELFILTIEDDQLKIKSFRFNEYKPNEDYENLGGRKYNNSWFERKMMRKRQA